MVEAVLFSFFLFLCNLKQDKYLWSLNITFYLISFQNTPNRRAFLMLRFLFIFFWTNGSSFHLLKRRIQIQVAWYTVFKSQKYNTSSLHVALLLCCLHLWCTRSSHSCVSVFCFSLVWAWVWLSCSEVISSPYHTQLTQACWPSCQSEAQICKTIHSDTLFMWACVFLWRLSDKIKWNVNSTGLDAVSFFFSYTFFWLFCPLFYSNCSHFIMMPLWLTEQQNDLYLYICENRAPAAKKPQSESLFLL